VHPKFYLSNGSLANITTYRCGYQDHTYWFSTIASLAQPVWNFAMEPMGLGSLYKIPTKISQHMSQDENLLSTAFFRASRCRLRIINRGFSRLIPRFNRIILWNDRVHLMHYVWVIDFLI
jgi:hypothetical protein